MRISTLQIFTSGLRQITDAQAAVVRAQSEVASGKRVQKPSDDPSAAALALKIEADIALNAQYRKNADIAESEIRQTETQLESVENVLFRLHELVVQAGNAALSSVERNAILTEAAARKQELIGLFNSRNASGEYLFSGSKGTTLPFAERPGGAIDYAGDQVERKLAVAPGVEVQVRDDGRSLFVDIPAANRTIATRLTPSNSGTGDISTGRIVDQAAWDAIYPRDLIVVFGNPPNTFTVVPNSIAQPPILGPVAYVPGQQVIVGGVEVRISGSPAAGDQLRIEAVPRQSLLDTVQRFIDGMRASGDTTAGATERARVIAETLANLDLAEQSVFGARADLGARLNVLDSVRAEQQDSELIGRKLLSDLVDVDYNEAVSRLSLQNFVLQAAQQSFATLSKLSLFNFLR